MDNDDDKVNKVIMDLPKDGQDKSKSMMCTSNFEDHSFYNVEEDDHCGVGDDDASVKEELEEEVDVMECTGFGDENKIEALECNDGTDDVYSSSFSGTVSEHENESALNDQEADSMICSTDTSLPLWVRKKKLTDHWRRFIQPIAWRCKWVELKIREFQNQARMYDKELKNSCQAKQLELENLKSEELGTKALPSPPCHLQKTRVNKRKKRKRVEETSDVAAYTQNHNLFSYYECRKSFGDSALNDNSRNLDKKNKSSKEETVFCEETPPLEFKEGDAYLEEILLKIEAAKLEARNMKRRVDKVIDENPYRFSSVNTDENRVDKVMNESAEKFTSPEQEKPLLVFENEDEKPVIFEEKTVKSASVSSHHDTQSEEENDEETGDILLSEILASKRRRGKAIILDKKLQKTEQVSVEEGSSRTARKRTPRSREVVVKEEIKPKRQRVSREKPKSNVSMASSRFKLPNRKTKRGKRRSGSVGLRRRSEK